MCSLNYFEVSCRVTIGQAIQAHTAMVMILHYTGHTAYGYDAAVANSEHFAL